ncbi:MAG: hypothetical protein ABIP55_17185 [Tepidisphaeraceae bacterium]
MPQLQEKSLNRAMDDDPLSHLHRMSTTAGLGSGDYVAVNAAAVAALLLGLASALVLLEEFLLVLPLAGIVVSILAWRQISNSSGTQTGKALIAVGLLCAVGFGGFVITREATEGMRTRKDRAAIAFLITEIGEKTKSGDFTGLYGRFSDRFQERVKPEEFARQLGYIRQSDLFGTLKSTTWNGLAEFQKDEDGNRYAAAKIDFNTEKTDRPFPATIALRKADKGWVVDAMPELFPAQQQPQQQRPQ